jgi:AraC family transcriptional regulator
VNLQMQNANALNCRANTHASRSRAVERVIKLMREKWDEPMTLQTLADAAGLSPYHFNRVFRHATGIPPCHFLAAIRLEAAKRLLLTTRFNVVDVCFEVGYDSLGTFTTRFTQMVGLPPRYLRRLSREMDMGRFAPPEDEADASSDAPSNAPSKSPSKSGGDAAPRPARAQAEVSGRLSVPAGFEGVVFVGLFTSPVPQGRPAGCALMSGAGEFTIRDVPDGTYYVLASAANPAEGPMAFLLPGDSALRGKAGPVVVSGERPASEVIVQLRPSRITDPPILVSLPMLLGESGRESAAMWYAPPRRTASLSGRVNRSSYSGRVNSNS